MQDKGDVLGLVFFALSYILIQIPSTVQCCRPDLLLKRLSGEKISVGISASAGFEQANGELQPDLGKVRVKSRIFPSTELEAGQKSDQTAIAPCCCSGWGLLVFSKPPVSHVPSPLEAFLGGRSAAEHLSAGVIAPGLKHGLVSWIPSHQQAMKIHLLLI